MSIEQDIVEAIDEYVDDIDPSRIEREAEQYGLTVDEYINRIVNELKVRLA
jgi:hypothetical protein